MAQRERLLVALPRKIRRVSSGRLDDDSTEGEVEVGEETLQSGELNVNLSELQVASKVVEVERRVEDLSRRFRQVADDTARSTGKAVQASEDIERLNSGFHDMQTAFDENADLLEAIERDVTELKTQFGAEAAAQLAKLDGRFEAIESGAEALRAQLASTQEALEGQKAQVATLVETRLHEVEETLRTAQSKWMSDSAEKGATSKEVAILTQQFEDLRGLVTGELERIKVTHLAVDQALKSAGNAVDQTSEAFARLEDVRQQMADAHKGLEELSARIAEANTGAESSRDKVALTVRMAEDIEAKVRRLLAPVEDAFDSLEEFEAGGASADLGFELHDLLHVVVKHNASDLHIKVGAPPTVRLDGELVPVGSQVLTAQDCKGLIFGAITRAQRRRLFERKELDFAYTTPTARYRVNAFLQRGTVSAAFRMLRTEIPALDDLGLPPVLKQLAEFGNGLILVTGPAGMGKSTTLAAMIDHINSTRKQHIITIEDPIEFLHTDKMSLVTQREIGADTTSYTDALRQALRQDPNVILIGEMRDAETIMTAATAAETGHLVLSTLHTPNATQAIDRILDTFKGDQQAQFRLLLSNVLRGVVSQRLLLRADGQGRIPAVEVMIATSTITSLILEGRTQEIYPYMQQGATEGMQTFTQSLTQLYESGLITREEAMYHADQPTEFRLGTEGHVPAATSSASSYSSEGDTLMNWL